MNRQRNAPGAGRAGTRTHTYARTHTLPRAGLKRGLELIRTLTRALTHTADAAHVSAVAQTLKNTINRSNQEYEIKTERKMAKCFQIGNGLQQEREGGSHISARLGRNHRARFNSGRTALLLGFDANNTLLSEAISVCVCVMTIGSAFPAHLKKMFAFEKSEAREQIRGTAGRRPEISDAGLLLGLMSLGIDGC